MKAERWLKGPLMREFMIDHILCRPSKKLITLANGQGWSNLPNLQINLTQGQTTVNGCTDQDGYWISTTKSIDWSIYEIARRLTHHQLTGQGQGEIKLAVINTNTTLSGNSKKDEKVKERIINPHSCLLSHESGILSPNKLEASKTARERSWQSFELLYWGRIFGESISEDLTFTAEYLPFRLPSKFWRHDTGIPGRIDSTRDSELPGWLGKLRWDPIKDDWPTALVHLRQNLYPTTKWVEQPLHDWGSVWPPITDPPRASSNQLQRKSGDDGNGPTNRTETSLHAQTSDGKNERDHFGIGSYRGETGGKDDSAILVDLMS
ncbi:uncharacterized protein I206_103959 [Kwoniella pini CBS 10737]|uniref:Uncharacterized protein n=1 Tax=Kwoniella pini CBS 10737 TaxID=1296096 RepID=A0A1B9I323_9TREE|nr:uncharacterized protein I206_04468 [Kwoniella pini CBS 10737]OCF49937.1 hypothetical protein I206_04468 [Kwoniella pini CBS 10737]